MELVSLSYTIRESKALSPTTTPSIFHDSHLQNTSGTSFPIIAVAVIGIVATAFLLVSYYVFVIKCCLSWHRIDLLRRFSLSRRRNDLDPLMVHSPEFINRGLDESVIRSIPVFRYNKQEKIKDECGEKSFCECAVCLNEFEDDEKLKIIPNCAHVFHIDCIDIWLQNNPNCPLCRTSVSGITNSRFSLEQIRGPSTTPQDPEPYQENILGGDRDFVVIELRQNRAEQTLLAAQGRLNSGQEEPNGTSPWARKIEQRTPTHKKAKKFHKGTSMGDEVIDIIRGKDERFEVQPIRRSISMDSSADRALYLAVQEAVQRRDRRGIGEDNAGLVEGCMHSVSNSGRVKRSFFSFGSGRGSRSAVLPVALDP